MGTEHITYRHFGSETFHPEYFGKIVNDPSRMAGCGHHAWMQATDGKSSADVRTTRQNPSGSILILRSCRMRTYTQSTR